MVSSSPNIKKYIQIEMAITRTVTIRIIDPKVFFDFVIIIME